MLEIIIVGLLGSIVIIAQSINHNKELTRLLTIGEKLEKDFEQYRNSTKIIINSSQLLLEDYEVMVSILKEKFTEDEIEEMYLQKTNERDDINE